MPIPDLPGELVPRNSDQDRWLKSLVAGLCQLDHERFPGSQPVSFGVKDLAKLESQDYWVCEKSDGIRVLFLIATNVETLEQDAYLIDRHNSYRRLEGFFFPHHETTERPLRSTLIDGELVIDVDKKTKQETLRFLAFDCLVIDDQNVMSKTLDKRYGRLQAWFYKPYRKMLTDHPHVVENHPFDIKVKEINFSYYVEKVFNVDIPALQHENDGLIYTCVNTPYTPGTDTNILKWKPPSENSIDFKLVLRFPPLPQDSRKPDFRAKPLFLLFVWCGDDRGTPRYEQFDEMFVKDEEWEKLKKSGEQVDDRIVEVHWDPTLSKWRMMRFRDDKPNGNHRSVVDNIIQTIADGVEKDALIERCNDIRIAWKARHGQPAGPNPPPQQHQAPPSRQGNPYQNAAAQRPPALVLQSNQQAQRSRPSTANGPVEYRYGPLAPSLYSKVVGPTTIAGMKR